MTSEVAIDVMAALMPSAGIGRYVRDLAYAATTLPGAPATRFIYPRGATGGRALPWADHPRRELALGWRLLRPLYAGSLGLGFGLDPLFGDPAVVHSTMGHGPGFARARLLLTIHDLTAIEHPEWHPRRVSAFVRATMPLAARRATLVMCDSSVVATQVVQRLGVPAERVVTVPLALSPRFQPPAIDDASERIARRFKLAGDYLLHVGTFEPRKNHVALIEAFEQLRKRGFAGPLVFVGRDGWRHEPILARLEASPARGAIRRLVDVDDDDLAALYTCCAAFAFPSIEEGFGYPLLEALACGASCVASTHAALAEISGGVATLVPAADATALASALGERIEDRHGRAALAERGRARAAAFSFEPWALRMFAIYGAALAGGEVAGAARSARS